MPTHAEHHYVPKFLLKPWEGGADKKLSAFSWVRGRILEERYKAKSVAKVRNLYAIQKTEMNANQSLERDFMGRLDDPAAQIHQLIVSTGLDALSSMQRYKWSIFLTSLALRGPGAIDLIRTKGINALNAELEANPDGMLEERGPSPEASLRHFLEKHDPTIFEDFGMMSFPHVLENSKLNRLFYNAHWMTMRFKPPSQKLLIVDRPLTLEGAIAGQFLIYLPLAPDCAFLAFNDKVIGNSIRSIEDSVFIKNMNKATVKQASQYVFGTNNEHLPLIQRRLQKTPAGPGLAFGPRQPSET